MKLISNRKSNIEILRILSMIFIVFDHWGGHSSWLFDISSGYNVNTIFIQLTQFLGEVGNALFLIITGFFCINKNKIGISNLKKVIFDVKFYAIIIWLMAIIFHLSRFSALGFLQALFPIIYNEYWFVGPYLIVYFFSPLINYILNNLSRKFVMVYIQVLIILQLILPMIHASTYTSNIALFTLFYLTGACIRNGYLDRWKKYFKSTIYLVAGFVGVIIILCIMDSLIFYYGISSKYSTLMVGRFSIFPIMVAIGIFYKFKEVRFESNIINKLAGSMFAVYLISENHYIYPWLWGEYFNDTQFYGSYMLIPIALMQIIIVILACTVIDILYKKICGFILYFFSLIRIRN